MNTISSPVWQRRGSSIIFDSLTLGELLAENEAISLRQALALGDNLPGKPPSNSLLIYGLQTMLEILSPDEAYSFLLHRIRPLLMRLQYDWPVCGVILAFTAPPKAFVEDPVDDEIFYVRRDQKRIRLSDGLWDGSASVNILQVLKKADNCKEEIIGYYVSRIS